MNLDHHEEIFRKKLQGHHPPVDTQTLWKQIESEVESDKRERRPLLAWWLFGGLSALAIITLTVFLLNRDDVTNQPYMAQLDMEQATEVSSQKLKNENSTQAQLALIEASENTVASGLAKDEKINENLPSSDIAIKENTNSSTFEKANNNDQNSVEKTTSIKQTANKISKIQKGEVVNFSRQKGTNQLATTTTEVDVKSELNKSSIDAKNVSGDKLTVAIKDDSNSKLDIAQESEGGLKDMHIIRDSNSGISKAEDEKTIRNLYTDLKTNTSSQQKMTSDALPVSRINEIVVADVLAILDGDVIVSQPATLAYTPIPARKRKPTTWYAMVEIGYGKYVTPNTVPESNAYTIPALENLYLETDYRNASLKLGYKIGRSFLLQTGIGYTKLRQRTFISDAVEVSSFAGSDIDVYYANDSSELAIISAGEVNYISNPIIKTLDRHLFEVPLLFGYERTFKRMYVGAQGGMLCYFATTTKGDYIDERNRLVNVPENRIGVTTSLDNYKTTSKFGIGYQANLSLGYYITPTFDIYISPQVKYISGILTSTASQTELGVLSGGAQIGLRMRL